MKITLRQLEVFAAIASHGQVTRAAQAVAMTQAAASMALADLEAQLGVMLFDRVGRQLRLNDSGRELLPRACEVLDRVQDIEQLSGSTSPAFDLHLGASVTIGNHLMPALIARIKAEYPQGRVHVSRYNSEQVLAHLAAFRLDLGFVEGFADNGEVQRFPWRQDRLVAFAAPGHPLVGQVCALPDLAQAEWVLREAGSGTREVFEQACLERGFSPRVALELEQPEAIRQCVKAGLGLGCLSELELEDAFRAGSLVPLQTPDLVMLRHLDVVINRHKFISHSISAVLHACEIDAAELRAGPG